MEGRLRGTGDQDTEDKIQGQVVAKQAESGKAPTKPGGGATQSRVDGIWAENARSAAEAPEGGPAMAIIAISQQMGSGGDTIAAAVANTLGYAYADRQMIVEAAKAYDVPETALAAVSEDPLSGWHTANAARCRYRTFLDAAFFGLAEQDNIVTASRGTASLVRGISHALRVRIIAPFELRVARTRDREHLSRAEARHRVRKYDHEIVARIGYLFGPEWALPESYDVVVNTERETSALYADMIVAVARDPRFQATPDSLQVVRNRSLAAHVRAAIARDPDASGAADLEVTADRGRVGLRGSVRHLSVRDAVLTTVSAVPGARSVSGEEVTVFMPYP